MMKKIGFFFLFFSVCISFKVFSIDSSFQIELFNQGNDLFQKALESSISNPEDAGVFYDDSLSRFLQISESVQNGKLYYNIGNIYFQSGDIGRAILSYRKAALLIPGDRNLKENLAAARARRVDSLNEKESSRIIETIFSLYYNLSSSLKAVLFAITLGLVWICAAFLLLKKRIPASWYKGFFTGTLVFSILALILLGSVLINTLELKNHPGGVITADAIIARKGDGLSYSPSFEEPLHSGLEFTLINRRTGWYYIELSDNTRTWIPDNTADLVVLE